MKMRQSLMWMMLICVLFVLFYGLGQYVICREEKGTYNDIMNNVVKMKLGGFSDSMKNGAEIDDITLFSVQEHNGRENGVLELARVLKTT
ncbi:Cysteine proteinase inhibitor 7 [Cardamine amara subsp. amara]|uniref:Cysteine proteinase inhibitor 7 n=1 Tax=Cardamine amara subsp. amara TaxID=228776 RepID=A0ABD1C1D6_CARAN